MTKKKYGKILNDVELKLQKLYLWVDICFILILNVRGFPCHTLTETFKEFLVR